MAKHGVRRPIEGAWWLGRYLALSPVAECETSCQQQHADDRPWQGQTKQTPKYLAGQLEAQQDQ